jgi:hypothetical protein
MLTHRLHVLLDEERWRRLEVEAARRDVAVAVIVREAIDDALARTGDADRRAAADLILAAEPMEVPDDPADLKRELDEIRAGGL